MDQVIPAMVVELQNLPRPTNKKDYRFLENLNKIIATYLVLKREKETNRLEFTVVNAIIKAAFPEDITDKYLDLYVDLRTTFIEDGKKAGTMDDQTGRKQFEAAENQENRLTFLIKFVEKEQVLATANVVPKKEK